MTLQLVDPGDYPWMAEFVARRPEAKKWKLTKFHYPGTHDSGTYFNPEGVLGLVPTSDWLLGNPFDRIKRNASSFNWRCQEWSFYTQLKIGIRCLDLRIRPLEDAIWWPCHGVIEKTGHCLAAAYGDNENEQTAVGQIQKYLREHRTELVIINLDADSTDTQDLYNLWATLLNAFQNDMLPAPKHKEAVPTYEHMVETGRNLIITANKDPKYQPQNDDILLDWWNENIWPLVDNIVDQKMPEPYAVIKGPYNESIWKDGQPDNIQTKTDGFMLGNETILQDRDFFWLAQCQLTPSLVGDVPFTTTPDFTTSPEALARDRANPWVKEMLVNDDIWLRMASVMSVDFPDGELIRMIVGMNDEL